MKTFTARLTASPVKASVLASGIAALLLTTGCSATPNAAPGTASPSVASAAASSGTTTKTTPTAAANAGIPSNSDKYGERLVLGTMSVKAGGTVPVSGGTLTPGITVKVYAAKQEHATYNASTGMYSGSGEVLISDAVNAVVDAQGHYDVQLLIPAGTAPQTMNVELILPDGNANLLQMNVT